MKHKRKINIYISGPQPLFKKKRKKDPLKICLKKFK